MTRTINVELSAMAAVKTTVWAHEQIRQLRENTCIGYLTATDEERAEAITMFEDMVRAIDKGWEGL